MRVLFQVDSWIYGNTELRDTRMEDKVSDNKPSPPRVLPQGGFFAQLDKLDAIQDYLPQQECVRLFGISRKDFEDENFLREDGCHTYVLDIESSIFFQALIKTYTRRSHFRKILESRNYLGGLWIYIDFNLAQRITASYAYVAFAESGPQYINIRKIKIMSKPIQLPPLEQAKPMEEVRAKDIATLSKFHVGQGMCSVYTYGDQQYLLDAGAGKPVTRQTYQRNHHPDGTRFRNELRSCLSRQNLNAVISHLDSDHWRLLEWDPVICAQLANIYFPVGTRSLALRSSVILSKVKALDSCTIRFDSRNFLAMMRTKPLRSDQNGEALVAVAVCDGLQALLPGDYVYERMLIDRNADLRVLATQQYSAVVVPHHGDSASARNVPQACGLPVQRQPIAFFSAGTHFRYLHPRPASVNAHILSGFDAIVDNSCPDIIEQRLL